MADHKKFADKRTNTYWVAPHKLTIVPGLNARDMSTPDNIAHVQVIAASIKANGFLDSHSLEVAQIDGKMVVTAGHCRYAAVQLLIEHGDRDTEDPIPYTPERQGTDEEQRISNQRISNSGKPLTPLEEGFNVKRLLGRRWSKEKIAEMWACSDTHITNLLELQAAPTETKAMVSQGEVSASAAVETIRRHGSTKGTEIIREAVSDAKASGKKKATPKHIAARERAKDAADLLKIIYKPKSHMLSVRLGKQNFMFTPDEWLRMGKRIVAEAEKALAPEPADEEERETEPV